MATAKRTMNTDDEIAKQQSPQKKQRPIVVRPSVDQGTISVGGSRASSVGAESTTSSKAQQEIDAMSPGRRSKFDSFAAKKDEPTEQEKVQKEVSRWSEEYQRLMYYHLDKDGMEKQFKSNLEKEIKFQKALDEINDDNATNLRECQTKCQTEYGVHVGAINRTGAALLDAEGDAAKAQGIIKTMSDSQGFNKRQLKLAIRGARAIKLFGASPEQAAK